MYAPTPTSGERAAWEEQAPIVPREPPPWFVSGLAWMLISLFLTILLASILVRVPETVRSRFVLVPEAGADPIESPRQAVLEQVLVQVGQQVKKGDRLFALRVDEVREWRTDTDAREQALRSLPERSAKLEEAHASALRIKDSEIDQAQREMNFRNSHLITMRDLGARVEKLAQTGFISQIELASHRLDLAQSEKDLEVAKKTLAQRRLEREGLVTERRRQRIEEKATADELGIRIAALDRPLSSSANGLLEIRAPYDAVCVAVTRENAGGVVAPGEQLCQLAPMTTGLKARLALPETGLSRLKPGQRVRLFFDAYPYQRFGVVSGAIDWISPAAVTNGEASDFVALASLDKTKIVSRGDTHLLKPGMNGEARVVVGRRALIQYVFEPLRKLREDSKS